MPLAAEAPEPTATKDLRQPVTPKPNEHRQKQRVVFSPGELMFSFVAVYPRHCPCILPDLFFSWASTLTSIPFF